MDVIACLPADAKATETVQVREHSLDDPALGPQAGAVLGPTAGGLRLHDEVPDQAAVLVLVVAAVGFISEW